MQEQRILFDKIDIPDIDRLPVYTQHGGGAGIRRALSLGADAVIDEVEASGLRGRAGAWRPVGARWRHLRDGGGAGYVVADLLEPEPGRFRDRKLAERQPHRLLEGVRIAAQAVGAAGAYVCVRADARRARETLGQALDELRAAGLEVAIHLHPVPGPLPMAAGDSLPLQLLSGDRPEPRADDGTEAPGRLFGRPALVHTASTLGYLPHILATGAAGFRNLGSAAASGTQAFCVSGLVRRPGLYEVELGAGTFRDLVDGLAGGVRAGRQLKFVLHAGYGSTPVLADADLGCPLDPGQWAHPDGGPVSGGFGSGVVIVADDTVCAVDTARLLAQAYADTACAKCLPCREGTAWAAEALARLEAGAGSAFELELLLSRGAALTSPLALCGHGPQGAAAIGALHSAFPEEFEGHLAGTCPVAKDLSMKVPDSIHVRF